VTEVSACFVRLCASFGWSIQKVMTSQKTACGTRPAIPWEIVYNFNLEHAQKAIL
jgi:hypothetical protein